MSSDSTADALVKKAFEIAQKPEGERTRTDLESLAELGGDDVPSFDDAFQRIRAQGNEAGSTRDLYDDAADALTEAAKIAGHEVTVGPGIRISPRRDR